MKVLLYFENENLIQNSGIGRALEHQKEALTLAGIEYTTEITDKFDILHINTVGITSEAMITNARLQHKKVIYHAHSTEEDFKNSFIFSNLVSPLFKSRLVHLYSSADAIITPTPYSKQLIEQYGINLPIYPISNGIQLKKYEYSQEKVDAFRSYFNLKEDTPVIMGVGLPFERKGIKDFVEVAAALPEYQFIWFGELNPLLVPSDINKIIENPPANCLFPGYIKGEIIEGAYLAANCFFFPSYEETEGIVVLEALASKQMVLVRDIGAFHPWLIDGENCYKANDNETFIKRIKQIVNKEVKDTTEKGYLVAKERSIETIGQQLKEVYEKTIMGNSLEK